MEPGLNKVNENDTLVSRHFFSHIVYIFGRKNRDPEFFSVCDGKKQEEKINIVASKITMSRVKMLPLH